MMDGSVMHAKRVKLGKGANVFISVWNLHRNPHLWDNPTKFDPSRWAAPKAPFSPLTSWKGNHSLILVVYCLHPAFILPSSKF